MEKQILESILTVLTKEIDIIFEFYKDNLNELEKEYDIYRLYIYIATIFCCFINYSKWTIGIFYEQKILNSFIYWVDNLNKFSKSILFENKIIIYGLSNLLSHEYFLEFYSEYYNKLLNISMIFLLKQKNQERSNLKAELKKEMDCEFIESDSEDGLEDDKLFQSSSKDQM